MNPRAAGSSRAKTPRVRPGRVFVVPKQRSISSVRATDVVEVDIHPSRPDLVETTRDAQQFVADELSQDIHVSLSSEFSQLNLNNALTDR